jgi:hypothetical protein
MAVVRLAAALLALVVLAPVALSRAVEVLRAAVPVAARQQTMLTPLVVRAGSRLRVLPLQQPEGRVRLALFLLLVGSALVARVAVAAAGRQAPRQARAVRVDTLAAAAAAAVLQLMAARRQTVALAVAVWL